MAHDPFDRSAIGRAVPDPSLRYPRILLPGMAHLLAFGRPAWIDVAYLLCELIFLGLGAWWLAELLERAGMNPWFAVLYVTVPVAIVSLDRMLVDLAATSLALGFAGVSRCRPALEAVCDHGGGGALPRDAATCCSALRATPAVAAPVSADRGLRHCATPSHAVDPLGSQRTAWRPRLRTAVAVSVEGDAGCNRASAALSILRRRQSS